MVRTIDFIGEILPVFCGNPRLVEELVKSELGDSFNHNAVEWKVKRPYGETSGPLLIGVPGGQLGAQAFYIILENFWRNLVKHNLTKVSEKIEARDLTVHVDFGEKPGTPYLACKLWANASDDGTGEVQAAKYLGTGSAFIDGEGRLIPEGWGLKEMLVAAGYLTGKSLQFLQTRGNQVLRCSLEEEAGEAGSEKHLVFEFDVLKPMVLTVASAGEDRLEPADRKGLLSRGVRVVRPEDLRGVLPSEYLVCVGGSPQCAADDAGNLPLKQLRKEEVDVAALAGKTERIDLLLELERDFRRKLCDGQEQDVVLALQTNPKWQSDISANALCRAGITVAKCEEGGPPHVGGGRVLVFDHHGKYYNWVKANAPVFWEPYSGGAYTHTLLNTVPAEEQDRLLFVSQLTTAALLRVVVLDERIQETLGRGRWTYPGGGLPPLECLKYMGIRVPQVAECPLNQPAEEKVVEFVSQVAPHVLTVHAGILEKLGKKSSAGVRQWVEDMKNKMNANVRRIVIHSGRGIPAIVPERSVPFLSFSSVEHWVASKELKSKYGLVQELLAARGVTRK